MGAGARKLASNRDGIWIPKVMGTGEKGNIFATLHNNLP